MQQRCHDREGSQGSLIPVQHWGRQQQQEGQNSGQREIKLISQFQEQGDDVKNSNTVVDILSPAAMKNAYYICHNVQVKLMSFLSC